MNVCREFRDHIFEILSGEVSSEKQQGYLCHWSTCLLCQEELKVARRVWNSLDHYQECEVPQWLREKTAARVYAEARKEEAQAAQLAARWGRLSFGKVLGAIVAGVSLSLIFILMLGQKVESQPLTSEQLLTLGTLWSGFLITGFCWFLGKFEIKNLKLSSIALFAILSTSVVMVGTYLCPDTTAYGWWKSTSVGVQVQTTFGEVGGCFVFGIFYVLPAALLISPMVGRAFKGVVWSNTTTTASVCVLLLLPAIYIQCAYLAKGLMFSWIGGAFIGAFGGILTGLRISSLREKLALSQG